MTEYEVNLAWQGDKIGNFSARENPPLSVAPPPEFGGPAGHWSPEELLVSAVAGCLMSTLLFFVDRAGIRLARHAITAKGVLDKTKEGLRFTTIEAAIEVVVTDPQHVDQVAALQAKLEKYCPVSNALNIPIHLTMRVSPE